jgi:hypothetical protein
VIWVVISLGRDHSFARITASLSGRLPALPALPVWPAATFVEYGLTRFGGFVSWWVGDVVRRAYRFGGWLFADSAGCFLGRFSHWWRSVWVSVFGERGVHTSVVLASAVLLGCQKRGNCTLGQLMSPRSESVFFASFLCRFGQRNDVPPRTVANSDEEKIRLMQTTNAESNNPALTPTANPGP